MFLFLLFAFSPLFSAPPYAELKPAPFTRLTPSSIISPGGTYLLNALPGGRFEVYDLLTDDRVLDTRYAAWTPPHRDCEIPTHAFFFFSPDERRVVADNYCVSSDSAPALHWAEVWELPRKRIIKTFPFSDMPRDTPWKFNYRLRDKLASYYSRAPFRRHAAGARAFFSEDGKKLCFLYPHLRVFDGRDYSEINGPFNMMGVDRDLVGRLTFRYLSAPFFLAGWKAFVVMDGVALLFNDLSGSLQDYFKPGQDISVASMEASRDQRLLTAGNRLLDTDDMSMRASFPCDVYLSSDQSTLLSCDTLYSAQKPYEKLHAQICLDRSNLTPSSTREFLFVLDSRGRKLTITGFGTQKPLQEVELQPDEGIFRDTDNGKRLILRNAFTGKIRVLERR